MRCYLHLRGPAGDWRDETGQEFADMAALARAVTANARGVMAHDVLSGTLDLTLRIDAEDEVGAIVFALPFADAVEVTWPGDRRTA